MSQHKPDAKQLEFDYPRGTRKHWLQYMVIPDFTYLNSRLTEIKIRDTTKMSLVLQCVESHTGSYPTGTEDPGCRLKLKTIAASIKTKVRKEGKKQTRDNLDTTTASRAIAACEAAGLLEVTRSFYKDHACHYRIVWYRVKQLVLNNPDTEHLINKLDPVRKQTPTAATPIEPGTEGTATFEGSVGTDGQDDPSGEATGHPLQLQNHPLQVAVDPLQVAVHPLQPAVDPLQVAVADTVYSRARALNHGFNHEGNQRRNHDGATSQNSLDDRYGSYCGWPYEITRSHLQNCFRVETLWLYALKKGFGGVQKHDRLKFYRLVYVAHEPQIRNCGGYLTAALKKIEERRGQFGEPDAGWPTDEASHRYAIKATSTVDVASEELKSGKMTRRAVQLLEMYAVARKAEAGE